MKYKAFISYKHSDRSRSHAEALERALKRYAKPLLRPPIKIFRDEKHMVPGSGVGLSELIRDGLINSEFLLFIAEKEAAESLWCKEELSYWCDTLGRRDQLIIIHVSDKIALDFEQDEIDWDRSDALPVSLKPYITSIPLYVDLTWVKKDIDSDLENIQYRTLINSIIARFRGVTPEEINDEEIKVFRRNRLIRNVAIMILGTLLLLSVITTWWALDQQRQTKEAQDNLKKEYVQRLLNNAIALKQQGRYDEAISQVDTAKQYVDDPLSVTMLQLDSLNHLWSDIGSLMRAGNLLAENDTSLRMGLEKFEEAYLKSPDTLIAFIVVDTEDKMELIYQDCLLRAQQFVNQGECYWAKETLRIAEKLYPQSDELKAVVQNCD